MNTSTPPTLETVTAPPDPMLHERCDICGHRAYVLVTLNGLPLSFCGHHFARAEPSLLAGGADVKVDVRENLTIRDTAAVHA
jgi:hypothetical protein